jgi:hypothetical protein
VTIAEDLSFARDAANEARRGVLAARHSGMVSGVPGNE